MSASESRENLTPECGHAKVLWGVGYSCNLPAGHDGNHGVRVFLVTWNEKGEAK